MEERLRWHKDQGHQIVILTASCDLWLSDWALKKGYDLLCTQLEIINNRITGKMLSGNNHGEVKVVNLRGAYDLDTYRQTYGYGDTKGDLSFLELVDRATYRGKSLETNKN